MHTGFGRGNLAEKWPLEKSTHKRSDMKRTSGNMLLCLRLRPSGTEQEHATSGTEQE